MTTLLVADYDAAVDGCTRAPGFRVFDDCPLRDGERCARIGPADAEDAWLLLAQPADDLQRACIGDQVGARVDHFLRADDLASDYAAMVPAGVELHETPRSETDGMVAVFRDLYGTKWDLLEPAP